MNGLGLKPHTLDGARRTVREIVTASPSLTARWHYLLGRLHEERDDVARAGRAFHSGLARDPGAVPLDRRLLEKDALEFLPRRRIGRFVAQHLDRIRERAAADSQVVDDRSGTVFSYWAQGIESAPEVVRLCHRQMAEHAGGSLDYLDDSTLGDLVRIPEDVARAPMSRTFRSDLVRLELLSRYGGTWLDATCLLVDDPRTALEPLLGSGFFAFTKRDVTLSTWFLASAPGHHVTTLLREALYEVVRHFGSFRHYLVLHHVFEALTELDAEFGAAWARTPRRSWEPPTAFIPLMAEPYDEARFDEVLSGSFVHKLTYKYDPAAERPGTMLDHLLRRG